MRTGPLKAIVVGAGPGGLSTALALQRNGMEVRVFERAPDRERMQVGGSMHIFPNATRVLRDLGVYDAAERAGMRERSVDMFSWRGPMLGRLKLDEIEEEFGAGTFAIGRGELVRVLADALDEGTLELGAGFERYEQTDGAVRIRFEDGREAEGDVVIGADGLRSAVRHQVLGETPLRFAEMAAFGSVIDSEDERIPSGVLHMYWGPGGRCVFYRLRHPAVAWFSIERAGEEDEETADEKKRRLLERFRAWEAPMADLVERTPAEWISRVNLYDREPVEKWIDGSVVLLGDAAHPITLNLGQGACMAIEDGVVLGRCLEQEATVADALGEYQAQRFERTKALRGQAWRLGKLACWKHPLALPVRDRLIRLGRGAFTRQQRGLMAHRV